MAAEHSYHGSPSVRNSHNFATSSTTSFNPTFEAQVNANMTGQNDHHNWTDAKGKTPMRPTSYAEADDGEFNEKMAAKQKSDLPPRFSTIFGPPTAAPPPAPVHAFESYLQETRRKSGVYIPAPLFWALFVVFLIMSAVLFAYNVIGFITNMPTRIVGGGVAPVLANPQQPVINVSPNFVMGQAPQGTEKETVTVTVTTTYSQSLTSSSSSSSSSSPSSSTFVNSTQAAGMIASELAGILHSQSTFTTSLHSSSASSIPPVTVTINTTPARPTVSSTVLLTVDASGHTLPPKSTVTSTTVIDQAHDAAWTSSVKASIQSALAENSKHMVVPDATSTSTSSTVSSSSVGPITIHPITPSWAPATTQTSGTAESVSFMPVPTTTFPPRRVE